MGLTVHARRTCSEATPRLSIEDDRRVLCRYRPAACAHRVWFEWLFECSACRKQTRGTSSRILPAQRERSQTLARCRTLAHVQRAPPPRPVPHRHRTPHAMGHAKGAARRSRSTTEGPAPTHSFSRPRRVLLVTLQVERSGGCWTIASSLWPLARHPTRHECLFIAGPNRKE